MKRLYKSTLDKKVMGVCGGLGAYFGIDPTVIRLIALILLAMPLTVPIYILLGILLPNDYTVNGYGKYHYEQDFRSAAEQFSQFVQQQRHSTTQQSARRDVTPDDDWSDF